MSRNVRLVVLFTAALFAVASPAVAVLLRGDAGSASFSDGQRLQGVVRAAELDLVVGERTVPISARALAPGDLVVGAIALENGGAIDLRYSLWLEADVAPVLRDSVILRAVVADGASACPTRGAWKAGDVRPTVEITGAAWADEELTIFGDATPGQDPGDRTLRAATGERVCLSLEAALDTPQAAAGRGAELVFVAVAEQIAGTDAGEGE